MSALNEQAPPTAGEDSISRLPPELFESDSLVLIVLGPVPFMITVTGPRKEAVADAYRRAGLEIRILTHQSAASS
jgi:hypothetical protein